MSLEKELVKIHKWIEDEKRLGDKRAEQFYNQIIRDMINPTQKIKLVYGTITTASAGSGIIQTDTGVSIGTLIAGGVMEIWPTLHWTYTIQGMDIYKMSINAYVQIYVTNSGANQQYNIGWWALYS